MTGDAERGRAWPRQDPKEVQEWLGQTNLIYGGLIAIGVVMVQPFLTAPSLDVSSRICIVAFSVAIPLLAVLVMINRQEAFRRRLSKSILVASAQVVGQFGRICRCCGRLLAHHLDRWGGDSCEWTGGCDSPHGGLHAAGTGSGDHPSASRRT
jgi:ribosomal protein S27AE